MSIRDDPRFGLQLAGIVFVIACRSMPGGHDPRILFRGPFLLLQAAFADWVDDDPAATAPSASAQLHTSEFFDHPSRLRALRTAGFHAECADAVSELDSGRLMSPARPESFEPLRLAEFQEMHSRNSV